MSQHTINLDKVQQASLFLISQHADTLIKYIYAHADESPFDDAETRVGVSEKVLIRLLEYRDDATLDTETLTPVISDLKNMIKECSIHENAPGRLNSLKKELSMFEEAVNVVRAPPARSCTLM